MKILGVALSDETVGAAKAMQAADDTVREWDDLSVQEQERYARMASAARVWLALHKGAP